MLNQAPPSLPPAVDKIWRDFVRQEARRGRRHIGGMVSIFVEVLVNRSVASAAPDPQVAQAWDARRSLWVGEIGRVDQALAAAGSGPGLVVPYAPLAPHELPADEPPLAVESLKTVSALASYRAQVASRLAACVEVLVGASRDREAFAGRRLEAVHRVSAWAPLLHAIGDEELAQEAASREQAAASAQGDAGQEAPPPQVTYRQLGETVLRRIADMGDKVAEKLPPQLRAAADAMVSRLRPVEPSPSSDRPPPSPPSRAPRG